MSDKNTSGHPPRVWLHGSHWWLEPREGNREYISKEEHEALRAADLLEIEKLKKEVEETKNSNYTFRNWKGIEDALATEREARKGDSAEMERLGKLLNLSIQEKCHYREELEKADEKNARLTAALEKIAGDRIEQDGTEGTRDHFWEHLKIAKEALGEAKK